MSDTVIVIVLIVLGGVLPLVGLGRVARRARFNLPKADHISAVEQWAEGSRTGLFPVEPFVQAAHVTDNAHILEWSNVRWDLGLPAGSLSSLAEELEPRHP